MCASVQGHLYLAGTCVCWHWPVCVSTFHAGTLNAFLKQKGQTTSEGPVWSLSGNQGDRWKQAKVSIHPTASFQVRPENPHQSDTQQHSSSIALYFSPLPVFVRWSIRFLGACILMQRFKSLRIKQRSGRDPQTMSAVEKAISLTVCHYGA